MDKNKYNNRNSSSSSGSFSDDDNGRSRSRTKKSTAEEGFFSSSPFFRSLRAFVRRGTGTGGDGADNITAIFCSAAASFKKPASVTCLSPEVLGRLRFVDAAAANAKRQQHERPPAVTAETTASEEEEEVALIGEDGRVEWSLVRIAADGDGGEGDEKALVEGARLAVVCHTALLRNQQQQQLLQQQRSSLELPFAEALPGVVERIVGAESKDEEVYVALCVCLTILERALYDIYRQGASSSIRKTKNVGGDIDSGGTETHEGDSDGSKEAEGVGERGASIVAPAMILRDLIATPEIKSALPEQMVSVLRLLLLPMGFNIRNLVVSFCYHTSSCYSIARC